MKSESTQNCGEVAELQSAYVEEIFAFEFQPNPWLMTFVDYLAYPSAETGTAFLERYQATECCMVLKFALPGGRDLWQAKMPGLDEVQTKKVLQFTCDLHKKSLRDGGLIVPGGPMGEVQ